MAHIVERGNYPALADLRPRWQGTLIANFNGPEPTTRQAGERVLRSGLADVMSYGRLFISNPDLPVRFAGGHPLAPVDADRIYGGGERGYTDYPAVGARLR
ncbi:hypothetical protein [Saccharopolyspora elongata]|uniref:hypothetical protein n=1 Tax=Saccharopolyspora elongata TaxID=2530387 RepID=UPI001A9FBE09|nr:hypothetical protein [Saccharopolyspora elongata]